MSIFMLFYYEFFLVTILTGETCLLRELGLSAGTWASRLLKACWPSVDWFFGISNLSFEKIRKLADINYVHTATGTIAEFSNKNRRKALDWVILECCLLRLNKKGCFNSQTM